VQGSLQLDLGEEKKENFSYYYAENMADLLKTAVKQEKFTEQEIEKAYLIASEKYSSKQWNMKF
jgi:lipoate-protein ligase A